MVRILSLIWTLLASILVTGLSFFYLRGPLRGFPFSFGKETVDEASGIASVKISVWSLALDIAFWWLIFSILWLVIRNYIFEA